MLDGTNTELITFKGWTLRVRASRSASPRLLVLIHGWTGDENSMWVFTPGLSADYWIIAPRAPHVSEPGGYSWRPSQPTVPGLPSLEMFTPAAENLIRLIDEYSASVNMEATHFDLVGFSEGAVMVNAMGVLFPRRVRKMGVLAGFVPVGLEDRLGQAPLAGKSIFVAHGTRDEMVPVDRARAAVKLLEAAGARVTYCEDEVAHKLSAKCLRGLEDYLKD